MNDHIEFRYDPNIGMLTLNCDSTAFHHVWKVIRENVQLRIDEIPADSVKYIAIQEQAPPPKPISKLRDRIALVSCALVTMLVAFVITAGVMQIMAWMKPPA